MMGHSMIIATVIHTPPTEKISFVKREGRGMFLECVKPLWDVQRRGGRIYNFLRGRGMDLF